MEDYCVYYQEVETLYGHNSRLLVREGAEIFQGQVVARVGSRGKPPDRM